MRILRIQNIDNIFFITLLFCFSLLFTNCDNNLAQNNLITYKFPIAYGKTWNYREIKIWYFVKKDSTFIDTTHFTVTVVDTFTKNGDVFYSVTENKVGQEEDSSFAFYFESKEGFYLYATKKNHWPILSACRFVPENQIDTIILNQPFLIVGNNFIINQKWICSAIDETLVKTYVGEECVLNQNILKTAYKFIAIGQWQDTAISYFNNDGRIYEIKKYTSFVSDIVNNQVVIVDTIRAIETTELF